MDSRNQWRNRTFVFCLSCHIYVYGACPQNSIITEGSCLEKFRIVLICVCLKELGREQEMPIPELGEEEEEEEGRKGRTSMK